MRKYSQVASVLVLFLTMQNIKAQLYVSPTSFVYVNDQYLTVSKDVNLNNNGNLFLRNQGQLLQKTNASSLNAGEGKLSIFQEGTVNNYAYNYWCSPVGKATLSGIGNDVFGATMLNRPFTVINSAPATLAPSPAFDGTTTAGSLTIATRWIYKYLFSNSFAGWVTVGSSETVNAGEGFTMKGVSGDDETLGIGEATFNNSSLNDNQRYDFRGKPNDGNINVSVQAGQKTLTGNPYPSAIDLKRFLTIADNPSAANCTGIAYFWEQDKTVASHLLASYKGGYGSYAAATNMYLAPQFYNYDGAGVQLGPAGSGTDYPRQFSPVGQGFMIEGAPAVVGTALVTMTNDFRVFVKEGGTSHFDRNSNNTHITNTSFLPAIPSVSGFDYTTVSNAPTPQIRFNTLMNSTGIRQVALAFLPTATDGVDHGMDAKNPDATPVDMYFVIDNKDYVIETVNFDINKKIPIGFKNTAAPATFKITVNEMINFDGASNVYIHDKDNDTYHDILNSEYEMTLPIGVNNTRFEITFINAALSVPVLANDSFNVFQNNNSQFLNISNPNEIAIKSVDLYNISGKLIFNKTKLATKNNYQFSTSGISDAVYIVKITTTNNQDFSKKITVYNGK